VATFAELQTRVERRVIDLPAAVKAEIPTLVNEAVKSVMRKHNFQCMKASISSITTVDEHLLFSTPADWKEWREMPYAIDDFGVNWELGWAASPRAILTVYGYEDRGRPFWLMQGEETDLFGNTQVQVWPLPDGISDYADGEYRVHTPYWKFLPPLVNAGDSNWFTNNLELYIVFYATREAFALDWDEERMLVWTQKAQAEFLDAVRADKVAQLSGVDTMVPNWRGYRQPRVNR
jgi:hypothetical protein